MRTLILVIMLTFISSNAYSACSVHGSSLNFSGDEIDLTEETDSGFCSVDFRLGSRGNIMLTSLTVKSQPKNGFAKTTDDFSFNYWAVRGFSGEDHFSVEICANRNGAVGCTLENAKVNVSQPSKTDLTPEVAARLKGQATKKKQ